MKTSTRRLVAAVASAVLALLGVAVVTTTPAQAAFTSSVGGTITRAEVMERAQYWVDHQPGPYSQEAFSPDPTHSRNYRRDCSGYVDMAWHTDAHHWTGNLSDISSVIPRSSLKPGDILNAAEEHVIIFKSWANADRTSFNYYSFGSTPVKLKTNISINASTLDSRPNSHYVARRYHKIIDSGSTVNNDFDGDGVSDIAIYRTAAGQWNMKSVKRDTQLYGQYQYGGIASDIPLTGDFDGDGYTDIALYRKSLGQWHIKSVKRNDVIVGEYPYGGLSTDIPVVGDFDGDGYDDIGLYRAGQGQWALKSVRRNAQIVGGYPYGGLATDMPVVGDFDGDGYDDIGLYRAGQGEWALKSVHRNTQIVGGYPYGGLATDTPVIGDYDGDGYDDIGLYRAGQGQWALKSVRRNAQIVGGYQYGGAATDTVPTT